MKSKTSVLFLVASVSVFAANIPNQELSLREQVLIRKRVHNIYNKKVDPEKMFYRPEKISAQTSEIVEVNIDLKNGKITDQPETLEFLGQKKRDSLFLEDQCQWLSQKFPKIRCEHKGSIGSWESIAASDQIENLTESWLSDPEVSIEKIPTSGKTSIDLWSDDYWKLKWGGVSYRYGEGQVFGNYTEAIHSYAQPEAWTKAIASFGAVDFNQQIETWSPAEKYDLITNNVRFTLTNEQKQEGAKFLDEEGDIEGWMGLCHGWAAAAIMAPKPRKTISAMGALGTSIKWFPHDIRALTTLAWANGNYSSNFVGQRCNSKNATTLSNGRLKDSDCFDNNPATFHLALANLVGIAATSFVMDAAFDYQVWNQPVVSFDFSYFSPVNPEQVGKSWDKAAVNYSEEFKRIDPFQRPLTRGKRRSGSSLYDDSRIDKIVGVIATVTYLGEVYPVHGDRFSADRLIRVTYTYDLELEQVDDHFEITGGEWHTNAHPDFLWVPQKGAIPTTYYDDPSINYSGHEIPSERLTQTAVQASRWGYPLCEVVSTLLKESSDLPLAPCH